MSTRVKLVLISAGLLVAGFGVVDTQAVRHRHSLTVKHYFRSIVVPPRSDPATNGVEGQQVTCPRGYRATGGGYTTNTIVLVPHADLNPTNYGAIAINQLEREGRLTVTIACIRGRTAAARGQARGPGLERLIERYRAQRAER
jgi:hypothetical protein